MLLSKRFSIPLERAWYCESCRVISNDPLCCGCDSAEHVHPLAPWLDREQFPITIPTSGVIISISPVSANARKTA